MGSSLSYKDKLSAGRLLAIRKWPWMRVAIFSMIPVYVKSIKIYGQELKTFGVTDKGILIASTDALEAWEVPEIATALIHEVCHLLRDHGERADAIDANPLVWNLAADCEINDDLREAGWKFPKLIDVCYPEKFEMPEKLTAEEYYRGIHDFLQKQPCPHCGKQRRGSQQSGSQNGSQSGGQSGEQSEDQNQSGQSGGGGQQAQDDQSGNSQKQGKGKKKGKGKGKGKKQQDQNQGQNQCNSGGGGGDGDYCQCGGGCGCGEEGHGPGQMPAVGGGWCGSGAGRALPGEEDLVPKDMKGRSKTELEITKRGVADAIKKAASQGRGDIPGDWNRWADFILAPPKVNWRAKLARACRRYVSKRLGAVDMSYHKPSRRQAGIGFGVGRAVLPSYFTPVPKVAVLVDTSGSMGTGELETAVNECNGVMKAISADVLFAALDAKVQSFQRVRYPRELISLLKGGGGTDFTVGFKQIDEALPSAERPKVLVFITDGQGPAPHNPPRDIDVIWVLVGPFRQVPYSDGDGKSITWGEQIEIDDTEKANNEDEAA